MISRPRLEVVADYKWIDWSVSVDRRRTHPGWFRLAGSTSSRRESTGTPCPGGPFARDFHAQSPIDERHVFANALFPAVTEDSVAAGVSERTCQKHRASMSPSRIPLKIPLPTTAAATSFPCLEKGQISLEENEITVQYSYTFAAGARANRRLEWQREEYAEKNAKDLEDSISEIVSS